MHSTSPKGPEQWLRGPVPEVPALLQPVAHALLQARDEVISLLHDFPGGLLWERPAGVASVGFHLQHMVGVLDRLFTYARGESLTDEQFASLRSEGSPAELQVETATSVLLTGFADAVERSIAALPSFEQSLLEPRTVGRAGLPSNVLGLLVHSAEHTMRHTGQLIVTARVLAAEVARHHESEN